MKVFLNSQVTIPVIGVLALALFQTMSRSEPIPPERSAPAIGALAASETDGTAASEAADETAELGEPLPEPISTEALAHIQGVVDEATTDSTQYARLDRSWRTLHEASDLLRTQPRRARALAQRVLEIPQDDVIRDQANWIVGEAELSRGRHRQALEAFDRVGTTPVEDHLELRRIRALLGLGLADAAAERSNDLVEATRDSSSRVLHYARETYLHSLHQAGRWSELDRAIDRFLARYTEYPRADLLTLWQGQAALAQGDGEEAAQRFDALEWELPYRPIATTAHVTLTALEVAGVDVPQHGREARFARASDLRRARHWDYAERALAHIEAEYLERRGGLRQANEVRLERVRNSYAAGDFVVALGHLEMLQARDYVGVSNSDVLHWLTSVYGRLDRIEDGAAAVRRRNGGRSAIRLHNELAEYYYKNGHFEEALSHYEEVRNDRRQLGWEHTLLLFITGDYDQAAVQFENLAQRNRGSDRRKYRYWQARSLYEAGHTTEATVWFQEIRATWPTTYYGLQSANRLMEIERSTGPDLVAAAQETDAVAEDTEQHPDLESLAGDLFRNLDLGLTTVVRSQIPDLPVADVQDNRFVAPARLHWDGPDGVADTFLSVSASDEVIDASYTTPVDIVALRALAEAHGDVFPELQRTYFLDSVGQWYDAWAEFREASLEFRALNAAFGRRRPRENRPIRLDRDLWAHTTDRRSNDTGFWGIRLGPNRWPVPDGRRAAQAHVERQITIYERRDELFEGFEDGLMAFGDHNIARRFAYDRGGWRNTPPDGEQRDLWSQAHPRAYHDLVTEFGEVHRVNPYVIWGLMTVESSYNPDSISYANARGLLQVIPKTGELVSLRLGYFNFGPFNLMNPELSIEYGAYYFSELLEKFHGQELLAFAGYNGGPHNVARWLDGWGDLPMDAFVELIPFRQARRYTRRVYEKISLFRQIYLGLDSLYLGQDLDGTYEMNINF